VIESVRLGRYDIGLCTESAIAKDLISHPLTDEPMVLLHGRLGPQKDRRLPLITIEPTSATWRAILPLLRAHHPDLLASEIAGVESFGAVVQMVKAGFGNGLAPLGLVRELEIERTAYREVPGVARPISLVTRKTVHGLAGFVALRDQLTIAVRQFDGLRSRRRPS
jgi:DNA-binding transcriptional LysR family regulator